MRGARSLPTLPVPGKREHESGGGAEGGEGAHGHGEDVPRDVDGDEGAGEHAGDRPEAAVDAHADRGEDGRLDGDAVFAQAQPRWLLFELILLSFMSELNPLSLLMSELRPL